MRRTVALLFALASSLGAQTKGVTPGPVYFVNLSQVAMQVSLNKAPAVAAPALTALPALQTSPVKIGTRSGAESPAPGLLATGSNVLSVTTGGFEYVATLKLGFIGPLSSPSGLAANCVVYATFFTNPAMATVACRLGAAGGETTITSGALVPR